MIETTVEAQCACLLHHGKKVETSISCGAATIYLKMY
jgi:hypothetical protein